MKQQTNKPVEITIKKNDAFSVLQDITRNRITDLESHIIKTLENEQILDVEDLGTSLEDVGEIRYSGVDDLIQLLFSHVQCIDEIFELSKSIIFMGDQDCPICGSELIHETDGVGKIEWTDTNCSNCTYKTSNEPDWDKNR